MNKDDENLYFCPPKLTAQYRLLFWDWYDLVIGPMIIATGLLWFGNFVFAIGVFFLLLRAYVTDEKSIYIVLKSVVLYVSTPQAYSQYKE